MDHNEWSRNVHQHRVEHWREQRGQQMAARPRSTSSNVPGHFNHRQHMNHQPDFRQQHGEGLRFNHGDQRWNSNYNYSGYREHHSPHKQYHLTDHRNHGYGQVSYHQQHGQKKGGHLSSHKSLYNDRKSSSKRFSASCGSITNTTEVGNQNVDCPPEQTALSSSLDNNVNTLQVNSECSDNVTAVMEDVLNVEPEVEKTPNSDERTLKISLPEPDRVQDNTVIEAVETPKISELNENILPVHQNDIDGCVSTEGDIISDISVLEPATIISEEVPTSFVDASSTIAVNINNSDDAPVVDAVAVSELPVEVNDHEILEQVTEPDSTDSVQKEPSEDNYVQLVSEPAVTVTEYSTRAYECTNVVDSETVTNVEEISATEQMASLENNSDAANETLDLELNLSFKPEIEIIVEDKEEAADLLKLNDEVASDPAANGQSNNEEASIIGDGDISTESDNDLSKEIEHVENKLANISIVNKEEVASNDDCLTPLKRERRQVLLDATNILPSSTIKFAVREVRKNDESEIIVTPVRRSARLSTLTPVSAHKNICVQKLDELSPEVIQKMKFVQNPAIDDLSEC